jgi:hypothetical protein
MVTWRDYVIEEHRRQSRLEKAGRERQYRLIEAKSSRKGWFQASVVRVGAWLEDLGCRMQCRYAARPSQQTHLKPTADKVVGG